MRCPRPSVDGCFPSPLSKSGHVVELHSHYAGITRVGGAKFWFHGLRNAFITVAERELMLPRSLTKRLVNHARPSDVTEGYAADWDGGAAARAGTESRRPNRRADGGSRVPSASPRNRRRPVTRTNLAAAMDRFSAKASMRSHSGLRKITAISIYFGADNEIPYCY